jgi:hypothetical protein
MDALWHRGSRRWRHGDVARCGSRRARFGATFPDALAVTLNSGTAQDHMPARSVVAKAICDHWKVAIVPT